MQHDKEAQPNLTPPSQEESLVKVEESQRGKLRTERLMASK